MPVWDQKLMRVRYIDIWTPASIDMRRARHGSVLSRTRHMLKEIEVPFTLFRKRIYTFRHN